MPATATMTEMKLDLPEFRAGFRANPEAAAELSDDAHRRYLRGAFPKPLLWFLRYPDMLARLARDAANLKPDDIAAIEAEITKRSEKQRVYRKRAARRAKRK